MSYRVGIRIRGIVEQKAYVNGTADGFFYTGGAPYSPDFSRYNRYGFDVSAPAQRYYLNAGEDRDKILVMDYRREIRVQGGATIHLFADLAACGLLRNCTDYSSLPDCEPLRLDELAPDGYDGHFIQLDVVDVQPD